MPLYFNYKKPFHLYKLILINVKASQFGKRHIIVGQLFIGVGIAYSMRVNMSVGIVAMTDKTSVDNFEVSTYIYISSNISVQNYF